MCIRDRSLRPRSWSRRASSCPFCWVKKARREEASRPSAGERGAAERDGSSEGEGAPSEGGAGTGAGAEPACTSGLGLSLIHIYFTNYNCLRFCCVCKGTLLQTLQQKEKAHRFLKSVRFLCALCDKGKAGRNPGLSLPSMVVYNDEHSSYNREICTYHYITIRRFI